MLAALLAGYLLLSGGDGFAAKMFGKETRAAIRELVADPARAKTATRTLKQGENDLESAGKQFEALVKAFTKADEAQSAGLDALTPLLLQAAEQRRATQQACLDHLFELRRTLTEEEWDKLLASVK